MDACAHEARGGGFARGARGSGASVAAVTASELEASDDHERGGELDRAMRALREDRGVACDFEREADVACGERDFCGSETAIELVARFGACVLRELDGAGALAGHRASGCEEHGDVRARCGVESGLAVELFEARECGVEAKLEQIDRSDDGGAACSEVTELATDARCESRASELGGESGLAAQDFEVSEIELGAQCT
ncbi:MAG TPA: hypothetical protein VM509_04930 [Planctomycetota bacterium]|nr:hypothetical protein [Planctomycetota bacterium]